MRIQNFKRGDESEIFQVSREEMSKVRMIFSKVNDTLNYSY